MHTGFHLEIIISVKPGFLLSPVFSLVLLYQQGQQVLGSDKCNELVK